MTTTLAAPTEAELEFLRLTKDWSPQAKAEFTKTYGDLKEGRLRAWYCKTKQRNCDGQPHEGYDYPHARGDQWPPADPHWFTWLLSGGRGSGKTRTGAEFARAMSKKVGRMALIAPTGADVRDTMIEGVSGLQSVCALAGEKLKWEPSKRRVTFESGAIATTFSGEEPDRLRGPQHGFTWLDEPAHMPAIDEVWDMMLFGLRLGTKPRVVLTTTPLPTKWMKARIAEPKTRTVRVSTYANITNLAETFRENVLSRYEGTRLGLQELHGQILKDVEGALWNETIINHLPADQAPDWREMDRIVIAIDPAGTNGRKSDETGIVVAGIIGKVGYVLEDASGKYSPYEWGRRALTLAWKYEASIIAEKNYGGDMVKTNIENAAKKDELLPRIIVVTAMKSKALRAEPIVALYEQTRVMHMGDLATLEDEMMTWIPGQGDSPNRVDAVVWALTDLLKPAGEMHVATPTGTRLTSGSSRGGMTRRRS